jgi:tRNA G18 (ribose-2'-O)-methylase SpoU
VRWLPTPPEPAGEKLPVGVPIRIDDPGDPRLDAFRGLRHHPRSEGRVVVEGAVTVERLVQFGARIDTLLTVDSRVERLQAVVGPPTNWYVTDRAVMAELTGFDVHRGVLAEVERPRSSTLEQIRDADRVVALEGLTDLENLGAIIRTAVALGWQHFVLDPTCADPWHRRSVRVSMGYVFRASFFRSGDWPTDLHRLSEAGHEVVGLCSDRDGMPLGMLAPGRRRALLLGSEGDGLSDAAREASDALVAIPMVDGVDSLNVGHAFAIAAYHCLSGRVTG